MKTFLFLLSFFCLSLGQAQDLSNPFYGPFYFGGSIDMKTNDLFQLTASSQGGNPSFSLGFIHQNQNQQWQVGGKYSRLNRSSDFFELLVRRVLFNQNGKRLFISTHVSHYLPKSFNDYRYFSTIGLSGGLNYAGKWFESGALYAQYLFYFSPLGQQKYWNHFETLGLYVGLKNQLGSSQLRTRISGTFNQDYTPLLSQQLLLKSGFNLGYALGFEKSFNANIGFQKNNFEVNLTIGNQHQYHSLLETKNATYLKAGLILHL